MSENPLLSFIKFQATVNASLADKAVAAVRHELADYTSSQFVKVATDLRKANVSEEQEKINAAVALILEIGSSLISGEQLTRHPRLRYARTQLEILIYTPECTLSSHTAKRRRRRGGHGFCDDH